jgi:phosphate:Na+ symporter
VETAVAIVGGVGFFLLGMAVMTDGLKALAGSALRTVLAKAAATSLSGTFWGAVVTLLVQSSSATTMTTIGLVSAELLTFPQGLSLVFGANIGTTGTGWLVALLGVRISLTAYALPIVFAGALLKLVGKGRWAASGAAIAGFALILVGLTTLQQGMGGLAEQLNPADLPAVLGSGGASSWSGALGALTLVATGIVMTTVMQSSTAAITVSLSALFAGAIGLDQAVALVIGQNIGTSTSSAMAAVGASNTAKRLAVAYIAFKLIAAVVFLLLFPVIVRVMMRASDTVDPVTLVAAFHTAYNVVGVAILLPMIKPFTRLIERIVPDRGSSFTRYLDPAALAASPIVAVEAARRTVAHVLAILCSPATSANDASVIRQSAEALRQVQVFLSKMAEPLPSEDERRWFVETLHALDHVVRLADSLEAGANAVAPLEGPEEQRAVQLYGAAMRRAVESAVRLEHTTARHTAITGGAPELAEAILDLERCAGQLASLRHQHRRTTLDSIAAGKLSAGDAFVNIDAVRLLDERTHHAWRATAHLAGAAT